MKIFIIIALIAHVASAKVKEKYMEEHMKALTRQVMLQQFFAEQRVRTEGQSGLKLVRQRHSGAKNYFTQTHSGYAAAAMHNHANNIRTVGLGEFTAVLNGIEFKTRHNDYRLYMPHRTSNKYHDVEPVPFPDVPPEVTSKKNVAEQIEEMRAWFKAWKDQDYSKRDYRKYFKPTLCYLEGAWTKSGRNIDEPFNSDRHFIDANTWMELHNKVRYAANSGGKSINENLSFLPTKIMGLINDTVPDFAQWNYRILCHPIKQDVPLKNLRLVEDLSSRMMTNFEIFRHSTSRAARFQFTTKRDRPTVTEELLDKIMAEVPGKNNYNSKLTDEGLDGETLNSDKTLKDVSKYHRWFSINGRDAMGTSNQHRGYNDDFLFTAMTTHPQVASVDFKKCTKTWPRKCHNVRQGWSYAIPLELIYLTPLSKWNPYGLKYHGDTNKKTLAIVQANGRNGGCDKSGKKAFNGTTSTIFYRTPSTFYAGQVNNRDAADTARGVTCVLNQNGKMQYVRATGTHAFLPNIKGVGVLRQRYPIFPVHGEGSSVWKELNALREVTMNQEKYKKMYWDAKDTDASNIGAIILEMGYSSTTKTSRHTHRVEITAEDHVLLKSGSTVVLTTSTANGHSHMVEIVLWDRFYFRKCDEASSCWDKHARAFHTAQN